MIKTILIVATVGMSIGVASAVAGGGCIPPEASSTITSDKDFDDYTYKTRNAGRKVFRKCKVCHTIKEGGKSSIGPNLHSVMGRDAGTVDGFKYSKAMKESGITWNETTLRAFLSNPKKYIPGNKMPFPGLKKPEQIENVISYIIEESK